MLLRRSMTLLLLLWLPLVACGEDASDAWDNAAGEEPPTPPPLEGVDATHLVESFPQVPVKEGEFWVRPGSVSNLVRKQQPEPIEKPAREATAPVAPPSAAAKEVAEAQRDAATNQDAANEQLVAEYAVPSTPPAEASAPRETQRRSRQTTAAERPSAATKPTPPAAKPTPPAAKPTPPAAKPTPPAAKPTPPAAKPTPPAAKPRPSADQSKTASEAPPAAGPEVMPSNNLSIEKAALATKIENRQPIGVSDSFAEGTRVYLFNTILNPDGKAILIHHKWYRGEERVTSIKLSIKAARWRTWSVIPVYGKGPWRVDIVEPSGRVIHSAKFTVN